MYTPPCEEVHKLSRPEEDRQKEILREIREIRNGHPKESNPSTVYSKDFIYFVVSMFVPVGYGEVDLIPRDSIWHPVIGWVCWAIPAFFFCLILWNRISIRKIARFLVVPIALVFISGAVLAIRSIVDRKDSEIQEEVFRNLSPHVLPPLTDNPMESVFSITNGSGKTTVQSGMLFCGINQILGDKGGVPVTIGKLSSAAIPNVSRLIPGDSRSEPCLMIWSKYVDRTQCVDMKLWMRYTIEPQPSVTKEKWFRLVGYQSRGGTFNWYPEPVGSEMDYCDYFKRQIAPPN